VELFEHPPDEIVERGVYKCACPEDWCRSALWLLSAADELAECGPVARVFDICLAGMRDQSEAERKS